MLLRTTTRVNHSKSILSQGNGLPAPPAPSFAHDARSRVMIPAHARPAHRRLRAKLDEVEAWGETSRLNGRFGPPSAPLGIISSGVAHLHAREAAPSAAHLKLGLTHPLPIGLIRAFVASVERCVVIEEGEPYLAEQIGAAGIAVEDKPETYRFGELTVNRARRILAGDRSAEADEPAGKPPELCKGCPHHAVFGVLRDLDCIVAGDIGCYTLGVLPPYRALDTCVDMGAAIGVGLGLRHVLPDDQARRVVSVIGDSTFVHSGITGLVEMVYNPPPTGHVVLILDNGTTAMTGLQEHAGTGRTLDHRPTGRVSYEDLARSLGIRDVHVVDAMDDEAAFRALVERSLASGKLTVIVARRPCILAAGKIREYERAVAEGVACDEVSPNAVSSEEEAGPVTAAAHAPSTRPAGE